MNIKGVLTDFDGVILDSFREGIRRIQVLTALHDIPFTRETRAKLFKFWGMPGIELLKSALDIGDTFAKRVYIDWEKLDKSSPPPLVPGAREALVWIRKNGMKTGLITSRHRENLMEILDILDLEREFAVVSAKEDAGPYHKPDPRAFRYALETLRDQYGIQGAECIFIGDTPSDIVAGHNAKLMTLVTQTGPYLLEHTKEYPIELGNILKSIDDLPHWIERAHDGALTILAH